MPLPSYTTNLKWWFDARDIVASDGDSISTWNDSSGNGHTATLSAGTATFHTNQFNGGPALTFASARFGISGSVTATGSYTIFAVYRMSATSGDQTITGANGGNALEFRLVVSNGGSNRMQYALSPFATGFEGSGTAAPDTSWHQGNLVQNTGTSLAFRLDQVTDTFISGSGLASANAAPTLIGATGGGAFLIGQLQVVALYDAALSPTNIAIVETSLATVATGRMLIHPGMDGRCGASRMSGGMNG